ncbi:MAG: RNA polymerase sigma factor [Armatimonadetes bacterium]|nr:RNA polymerase sigma factor [Armatimonadota bacterium]
MDPVSERAARGDREAMADIVRRHYSDVYRFCSRQVGAQAAEDTAQETFVTATRRIRRFRCESTMKTWLFGIALNVMRNQRRKTQTLPLADWEYAARTGNPSDALIEAQALRQALAKLSGEHREVVLLHEMEGFTYEECAEALGVPEGTVKSRLYHAFRKLRGLLEPEEATT